MDHCHTLMTRERRQTMDDELHSVVGGTAYIAYPEGSYPGKIPSDAEYFQDIAIHPGKDDSAASSRDTYCLCHSGPQAASVKKKHCQSPYCPYRDPAGLDRYHAGSSSGTSAQNQLPSIRQSFRWEQHPQTTATNGCGDREGEQTPGNDNVGSDDTAGLESSPTTGRLSEWDVSSDEVSVTEPPVGGQDRRGSPVAQDEHGGQVPAGPYTWSPYNPYDGTTAYQVCDRQYCADPEQP
ncbi:hypothetical protein H2201_005649 [Coniosporium apollinis]|uniref:Uncharacterized protein n=1 Tax=Coniosporium apollinis TaxID=61459 RepID=A0ABQ9NPD1_9PEZI|nr:hypothetical protein H2201_005649 [Coniosporium apollinis]